MAGNDAVAKSGSTPESRQIGLGERGCADRIECRGADDQIEIGAFGSERIVARRQAVRWRPGVPRGPLLQTSVLVGHTRQKA
jgi:hypothetical protein